jgi:hypothetical protein
MKSRTLLPILPIALAALLVGGCGKPPLVPDAPRGSDQWLPNVAMACTTSTTDASGAQVSYQFDWGDGNKSQWSQFMNGGVQYADTHSYTNLGPYQIKVRAKNSKKASSWSDPLSINVVAEGHVVWSIFFTDPFETEDPDSAEFNMNSFAFGSDNTAYVTSSYIGAVIARKPSGAIAWKFYTPDLDEFTAAPVVADDGTILVGCSNEFIYAFNSDGTVKWADSVGSQVLATGALGADGTSYFQTADTVYAINPADGNQEWTYNLNAQSAQALAVDQSRNVLYAVSDVGVLQPIDLSSHTGKPSYAAGADASGPVVGADGTVYVGGDGKLAAVNPDGTAKWVFTPAMQGVVSTPAITADGYIYVLVVAYKKRLALQGRDSLYAVNPDGTRRWACGLGEGSSDPEYALSAPKLDASGFIYVGDGNRAWCVAGVSAPAQSIWPMFQRDAQNTGRAR